MKVLKSAWFFYLAFFFAVECVVSIGWISSSLVPRPTEILKVFMLSPDIILMPFLRTAGLALMAYILSSILAFAVAVGMHKLPTFQKIFTPITLFFQTVPIIAIAPLLVIYFGYGIPSILTAALIICFFPVFATTLVGLNQVEKNHAELFSFLKAKPWQRLYHLEIPSAVPTVLAGLKTSAGLSVVGVVSGEFVAGGGLGALIDSARLQQRVDLMFAALVLLSLTGLTLMKSTEALFRLIFKRYFIKLR